MLKRRIRSVACITLVAIVIVHLRLNVLAQDLIAGTISRNDPTSDARPSCCRAPATKKAVPSAGQDRRKTDHHGPMNSSGCPWCPKGGCNECCIFCIYAKAPCGPAVSAVSAPAACDVTWRVVELCNHLPVAPVEEFFQPPRA